MSCCDPRGCDRFFGGRFARRVASRYRKRGLDSTASRIVEFLESRGIADATVLEIGGGVGEIQIELLRRGARRGVNLELSAAYEGEAQRLLAEAGLAGRVERRLVDIAVAPGEVEPADAVVPHRVVCWYPDYERLLGAAADRAVSPVIPLTGRCVLRQNSQIIGRNRWQLRPRASSNPGHEVPRRSQSLHPFG